MGFGPEGLGPPGLVRHLANQLGLPDARAQLQSLVDMGLSPRDAFAQLAGATGDSSTPGYSPSPHALPSAPSTYSPTTGFDHGPPGRVQPDAVGQIFHSLPPDVQQSIVRGADQLPQPVRDALDQLGITPPQVHPQGRADGAEQARHTWGPENAYTRNGNGNEQVPGNVSEAFANARGEAAQLSPQPPGLARAQAADAVLMPTNASVVREGVPQAPVAGQHLASMSQAERAYAQHLPNTTLPTGTRGAEGFAGAARDPGGNIVAMPDRMAAMQQALQHAPNVTLPQARPDALPMQAMASLGGATVLANPPAAQALPGHTALNAPAPPGTDTAAAQARDATQLAPAGHTIGGFLRRDLRRGAPAHERQRENWALALIAGARKRRADDAEEQMTSFQWLFWVLTIVAYGAIGVALVVIGFGNRELVTTQGTPGSASYALAIGLLAAIGAWLAGRRIANKAAAEED